MTIQTLFIWGSNSPVGYVKYKQGGFDRFVPIDLELLQHPLYKKLHPVFFLRWLLPQILLQKILFTICDKAFQRVIH